MQLWVIEGDNNEPYEDHRAWFVGIGKDIVDVEKIVRDDPSYALSLTPHDYKKGWKPRQEHPVQPKPNSNFAWEWGSKSSPYPVTLIIYPYEVEGIGLLNGL